MYREFSIPISNVVHLSGEDDKIHLLCIRIPWFHIVCWILNMLMIVFISFIFIRVYELSTETAEKTHSIQVHSSLYVCWIQTLYCQKPVSLDQFVLFSRCSLMQFLVVRIQFLNFNMWLWCHPNSTVANVFVWFWHSWPFMDSPIWSEYDRTASHTFPELKLSHIHRSNSYGLEFPDITNSDIYFHLIGLYLKRINN